MTGHIRRRGARSWELKFDLGLDPLSGKRLTRFHSFKGTKREAEIELAKLITAASQGIYVDPSKVTVAEFLDRWERDVAAHRVGAKSLERYGEILRTYVRPRIGAAKIQKLKTIVIDQLYAKLLREGRHHADGVHGAGLSAGSVRYVHRILRCAFDQAVKWDLLSTNPCSSATPPSIDDPEIEILTDPQIQEVLTKLRTNDFYPIVITALGTGARRGEILALRWSDVSFDSALLKIERAIEQTKTGLTFKQPKTKAGRRTITLPAYLLGELRSLWKVQQEQRLALGSGRDDPDALIFRRIDGTPLIPNSVSITWRRLVRIFKLPKVSFHALRHTHVSQLIASNVDILTISRRIGHSKPSVTLDVYGHLMKPTDAAAAEALQLAFHGNGSATGQERN